MKLTRRQRMLISKLNLIICREKKSGLTGYFLGIEDCTSTINGLIVKGLVKPSANRKALLWTGMIPQT